MSALKKEVLDIINSQFEVLETIDLFDYDFQLDKLEELLSQYLSYNFKHNQRIILLHNDTDYYVSAKTAGFTLYNLFLLLRKLKIPTEFLILFTNHHGIHQEITMLADQICNSSAIKTIYTELWAHFPNPKDIPPLNIYPNNSIDYLFSCLNGCNRIHRLLTLCYLKEYNLLSKGMISYHFNSE
jgi:hypothetical protein